MVYVKLKNITNSPFHIGRTLFGVNVERTADLIGTDLGIALLFKDAGAAVVSVGEPPEELGVLDGTSPTGAYSVSRALLTDYTAELYTETAGAVSALHDQSGNGRDLAQSTAASRPVLADKYGTPALHFRPEGNQLVGPLLSEFITATSGYMIVSFASQGISRGKPQGSKVITDAADGGNIITAGVGTNFAVYSMQYDGSYDLTPDQLIHLGGQYVVEFRKDATKLYCRVNKGVESEVENGALTALGYALQMSGASPAHHNGHIWEFAIWDAAPDLAKRDQIAGAFMRQVGVPEVVPDFRARFPTPQTTGPSGPLTPATGYVVNTPGALIENMDFTGTVNLYIQANDVTVRNCRFNIASFYCIRTDPGITGTVIENCDISGAGVGIQGSGTIRDNYIHGVADGIVLIGPDNIVTGNCIQELSSSEPDPHFDCIDMSGGQDNTLIEGNTIICPSQTRAINIDNQFSGHDGITVRNNYITGGTYTIYVQSDGNANKPIVNIEFENNFIGKGGFGFLQMNVPVRMQNNIDIATGLHLLDMP